MRSHGVRSAYVEDLSHPGLVLLRVALFVAYAGLWWTPLRRVPFVLLGGVLIASFLLTARAQLVATGLRVRWLWLSHELSWTAISTGSVKREMFGGRMTVRLQNGERLRLSTLSGPTLEGFQSAFERRISLSPPGGTSAPLPWWLKTWS